jgi:hypothetical protein
MRFHGTTSATQPTSSSNFLGGRCPHVPKILRPAQEVWMTVYGSWSRAAGQSLKRDLRREIFLLSLDKKSSLCLTVPILLSSMLSNCISHCSTSIVSSGAAGAASHLLSHVISSNATPRPPQIADHTHWNRYCNH